MFGLLGKSLGKTSILNILSLLGKSLGITSILNIFGCDIYTFVIIPFAIHFISYWTSSGIYAALDWYCTRDESFLLQYKLQAEEIMKRQKKSENLANSDNLISCPSISSIIDWDKYANTAKVAFYNQFWFLLLLIILSPLLTYRGISYDMEFPSYHVQAGQLAGFVIMLSGIFYYIHRLLHLPYFYKRFHKIHHEWQTPIGCSAIYAHPLEHILNNVMPLYIPAFLLCIHPLYLYPLIALSTTHSVNVHSGYNFFWCIAKDHDDHHKYFIYNYGTGLDWFERFHRTRLIDNVRSSDPNE